MIATLAFNCAIRFCANLANTKHLLFEFSYHLSFPPFSPFRALFPQNRNCQERGTRCHYKLETNTPGQARFSACSWIHIAGSAAAFHVRRFGCCLGDVQDKERVFYGSNQVLFEISSLKSQTRCHRPLSPSQTIFPNPFSLSATDSRQNRLLVSYPQHLFPPCRLEEMIGEGEVELQSTEAQKEKEKEKEVVVEGFTRHRPIVMSVHMEEVQPAGGGLFCWRRASAPGGRRWWRLNSRALWYGRSCRGWIRTGTASAWRVRAATPSSGRGRRVRAATSADFGGDVWAGGAALWRGGWFQRWSGYEGWTVGLQVMWCFAVCALNEGLHVICKRFTRVKFVTKFAFVESTSLTNLKLRFTYA